MDDFADITFAYINFTRTVSHMKRHKTNIPAI